ncbi:MAG: C-GCAxxG-C-C family protein [Chloroflexi bacterium]|nr:C-GCAxxG-C-C family protein [Chloroflexota bacterium]
MSHVDLAASCFREGFSCSQAVFSAFAPDLGLEREMALRVAGAFGGGMARLGETCGAVTGALMVIGLKHGQISPEDKPAKDKTYALARAFAEQFVAQHGSLRCPELLGCHIGTAEGMQLAKDKGLFVSLCPKLVSDAAEIVERLL